MKFIYLSKKIAIPNNVQLHTLSWNHDQGWITIGGDGGMLKVLKLDSANTKDSAGKATPSNLSMNQTLEGHQEAVIVTTWNENFRKLTSSDASGLIIVWMLHKGMWFEEMINNRNKSVVRDMKWTADGSKICIIYEDGAVIVGSVDGNRIWGRELPLQLALVEWSPDGRMILFVTLQGECHLYDMNGQPISKVPLYCMEDIRGGANIVGVNWYNGLEGGGSDVGAPALAMALDNGRVQLMRNESDDKAIVFDTGLRTSRIAWNNDGTVLAVAGSLMTTDPNDGASKEQATVHFYSMFGHHLRTLRVPGPMVNAISWEAGGLRLAIAVESYVYFSNVRPDYRWSAFSNTIVYAFTRPERSEHCVFFWDTALGEQHAKYVKRLSLIRASGDYAVLVTRGEEQDQHILILCNAIGSPVDSKYINIEPHHVAMGPQHVVVSSEDHIYVWQHMTARSKLTATNGSVLKEGQSEVRQRGRECIFHVDDLPSNDGSGLGGAQAALARSRRPPTEDPICCLCCNDSMLCIARESGSCLMYSLPHLSMEGKHDLKMRPQMMTLNCDSTKLAVIDTYGFLRIFGLSGAAAQDEELRSFERKDAWDVMWAEDDPDLFAVMEKARMYVFRGTNPEEPVSSTSYLCSFKNLAVRLVHLDELMRMPDRPSTQDHLVDFECRTLRDTRQIINDVGIEEACQFVESWNHERLWHIIAEHALDKLELGVAERSFVHCKDLHGVQLVKKLNTLDSELKQRAEIKCHFRKFDEAEALYRQMDRIDLAVEMRARLGDWLKVEKMLTETSGTDEQFAEAWDRMGEYYADRMKYQKAMMYFTKSRNTARLIDCFYCMEDYDGLFQLIDTLPEGDSLLHEIGERLASVGLCEEAVRAHVRGGDVKKAVDTCVLLNQWDHAVTLAEEHDFAQIEALLARYATHLLEKGMKMDAVELFRKAGKHAESARLLQQLARETNAQRIHPLRAKKLSVLGAVEVDSLKRKALDLENAAATRATQTKGATRTMAAATLDGLMTLDRATLAGDAAGGVGGEGVDMQGWASAEAHHLWLMAHRQLYDGNFEMALRTSVHLKPHEKYVGAVEIYSLIAVCAFHARYFRECSRAMIRLEHEETISNAQRDAYNELSLTIFSKHPPNDPKKLPEKQPGKSTEVCMASGKLVDIERVVAGTWVRCNTCKRISILSELYGNQSCPLCHSLLPTGGAGQRVSPPAPDMRAGRGDATRQLAERLYDAEFLAD